MLMRRILSAIYVFLIMATSISAFLPTAARYSPVLWSNPAVALRRGWRCPMLQLAANRTRLMHVLQAHNQDPSHSLDRRGLFWLLPSLVSAAIIAQTSLPGPALAAGDSISAAAPSSQQPEAATIWLTGKTPRVPGAKPKDKNDVRGTRKDPSFLRSIADCKNQCENVSGPDGLSKSKEECLSECQDICCTTYEQCTFAVPRI